MKTLCTFVYVRGEVVPQTSPPPEKLFRGSGLTKLRFYYSMEKCFRNAHFHRGKPATQTCSSVFNN